MTSSHEMKITFYSTSPKEETRSKYPKQVRTSYTIADERLADAPEINFGKPLSNIKPKTQYHGFKTQGESRENIGQDQIQETSDSNCNDKTQPKRSRSGRIVKNPNRYEPVENVYDDFPDGGSDSDASSEI